MKISYAITVCNEYDEIQRLIPLLLENKLDKQDKYFGRDKFLNSVIVSSSKNLTGQLSKVQIKDFNHNSLFGTVLTKEQNDFAA